MPRALLLSGTITRIYTRIFVCQMETFPRPELIDFRGVAMTEIFTCNWENIQNFQARPDDILIATYPKAGGLRNVEFFFCLLKECVRKRISFGNNLIPSVQ